MRTFVSQNMLSKKEKSFSYKGDKGVFFVYWSDNLVFKVFFSEDYSIILYCS